MGKEFNRTDGLFSLCGLNCGLCPMQLRGECSGCFNGSTCYQNCPIAPCSVRHGNVEYCYQCSEYPCRRYDDIDQYDSLISHRNQKKDLAKAKEIGIESYLEEQRKKVEILNQLLEGYDNGKKNVFFCLADNMLPLCELGKVIEEAEAASEMMDTFEKTEFIEQKLNGFARELGIELKLRPWRT